MTEHLWSLATPSHADWEAVSRGGIPDLTAQDVALAAAGLPRIEFLIALYSLAGDDSVRGCVRTYLLEHLLAEREIHQWARRVETIDGFRVAFAEPLVQLFLAEERRPSIFQAAPQLRAVALRVEPEIWRRVVSHQWACVASEFARRLVSAEDWVKRRTRAE
jgi:hypothetical protein